MMTGLGVGGETQLDLANRLQKGGRQAFAAVPIIMQMMRNQGASQREIMEAIPRVLARMSRGENVFTATQAVLNELSRGGLAQLGQMAGASQQDVMAAQGAAMLGLGPGAVGPEQMSRFGAAGGAPFAGLQGVAAQRAQQRKAAEDAAVDMFLQAKLGPGGELNLPPSPEEEIRQKEQRAERARRLAGTMEKNAYENSKDDQEFQRQIELANAQRQIAVTQSLQADRLRILMQMSEETRKLSRKAAEDVLVPGTLQNNGRP
jgi:hypothetical protein